MPSRLKGTLSVHAKAEAIEASPARSKYHGTIHLDIKDLDGERTYVDFETTVSGEGGGTPGAGILDFFRRVGSSIEMLYKAIPQAGTDSSGKVEGQVRLSSQTSQPARVP